MRTSGMNDRVQANVNDAASWGLNTQNTPGTSMHNVTSGPNRATPGFEPGGEGESQAAARTRVIDQTLAIARANGGEPADLG